MYNLPRSNLAFTQKYGRGVALYVESLLIALWHMFIYCLWYSRYSEYVYIYTTCPTEHQQPFSPNPWGSPKQCPKKILTPRWRHCRRPWKRLDTRRLWNLQWHEGRNMKQCWLVTLTIQHMFIDVFCLDMFWYRHSTMYIFIDVELYRYADFP